MLETRFDLPAWTVVFNAAQFDSSGGTLFVTFDNYTGGAQALVNSQVTNIRVESGPSSGSWDSSDLITNFGDALNRSYFSIDANGVPSLDLTSIDAASNLVYSNVGSGTWQLGTRENGNPSGPTATWFATGPNFTGTAAYHEVGFSITGTVVPEPAATAVLAAGLLLGTRRRRPTIGRA